MAMTTRCPQCGTAFKVVPDQLRVRNGLVRCGACETVFDGRACLVAQIPQSAPAETAFQPPPAAPPPVAPPAASPVPPPQAVPRAEPVLVAEASPAVLRGRADIQRQDPFLGDTPRDEDEDETDDEIHLVQADDERTDAPGYEPAPESHVTVAPAVLGEARTRYFGATDVGRTPPEFLDADRLRSKRLARSLWGYGCLLGLLLLAAQLVFVYRSAIAEASPALRPALESLCRPLGCEVGYARRIERIFITSSSLQPPRGQAGAPDGEPRRLVLRISLRNRYDQPQHWPALRLSLTDMSDTVVVRRVLQPADYLPKDLVDRPFEPGAEINAAVPIEVSGAQVNGYQLDKFFP